MEPHDGLFVQLVHPISIIKYEQLLEVELAVTCNRTRHIGITYTQTPHHPARAHVRAHQPDRHAQYQRRRAGIVTSLSGVSEVKNLYFNNLTFSCHAYSRASRQRLLARVLS